MQINDSTRESMLAVDQSMNPRTAAVIMSPETNLFEKPVNKLYSFERKTER